MNTSTQTSDKKFHYKNKHAGNIVPTLSSPDQFHHNVKEKETHHKIEV
jgi:hypothetical protein